ncbi:MAG: hypothetical protein GOU98_01500 [Candidatus Altiarchaeota archaeon]|nr:hypothetical protein [Candidatus Altiarchaeota archaeon]
MSLFYAIYAFIIGGVNISSGLLMIKHEGWEKLVGYSAILIAFVAILAGFQALLGFYVDPIMLLIPLVFAGFIIMIQSWRTVRHGGWTAWFFAIYNTFAWVTNVIQLLYLLQRRD